MNNKVSVKKEKKCAFKNCDFKVSEHDLKNSHCIFHCEKDDWYEVKNGEKDWNKSKEKVNIFWKEIVELDLECQGKDFDFCFKEFIFPKMKNNFLEIFSFENKRVFFDKVIFLDDVSFSGEAIDNRAKLKGLFFSEIKFNKLLIQLVDLEELFISFYESENIHFNSIKVSDEFSIYYFNNDRREKFKNIIGLELIKEVKKLELTNLEVSLDLFLYSKVKKISLQSIKVKIGNIYKTLDIKKVYEEKFSIFFDKIRNGVVIPKEVDLSGAFIQNLVKYFRKNDLIPNGLILTNSGGMINDEVHLNEYNPTNLAYKNIEDIYEFLQNYFSKKGEITESVKYAKGKLRVAKKRIEKFSKNEFDKNEQLEFLYAEMKKRYDDLSLYSEAEKFYFLEMDAKLEKNLCQDGNIFWKDFWKWILVFWFSFTSFFVYWYQGGTILYNIKSLVVSSLMTVPFFGLISLLISWHSNKSEIKNGDNTILYLYKKISNYNTSPIKSLRVLITVIIMFWVIFMLLTDNFSTTKIIDNGKNAWKLLEYSFTNSIPFLEPYKTENILELLEKSGGAYEFFFKMYLYLEKIISTGIILLFGLSLRRKFKR